MGERLKENRAAVEQHGIGHVSDEERHGSPKNLFGIWWSTNMTIAAFATGAISIQLGLGFWPAIIAMVLGILMGAIIIPVMSAMGWKLGVPQMLMTRPTFGRVGAIFPVIIAWLNFLGWFTILTVLGAQALNAAFQLPLNAGIVILALVSISLGVFGNDIVQSAERWIAIVVGVVFLIVIILAIPHIHWGYRGDPKLVGADWWGTFVLMVAIAYSYAGPGYTPYASDYTRYIPKIFKFRTIFGPAFGGMAISCTIIFSLGAAVLTGNPTGDPIKSLNNMVGGFAPVVMLALALGSVAANAMNVYSGGLTALVSGIKMKRWTSALVIGVIGVILALWAKEQFQVKYENYLLLVLYLVPPMDAIFIADFFFIRKGRYRYTDFYGNTAGLFNRSGWIAYIIGILVSIPFMSAAVYEGPFAKDFHGADVSYLVSMVISGLVYWGIRRGTGHNLVFTEHNMTIE